MTSTIGLSAYAEQQNAKNKRRFHLLMMEEREYYFQDYAGFLHVPEDGHDSQTATPFAARVRVKGRLHVCSKSLVFDPDDSSGINILRLPFRDIASIKPRKLSPNSASNDVDYFIIHTRLVVEIPQRASYEFRKLNLDSPASEFLLSLSYVDTNNVLAFINELHGLYRLSATAKPLALQKIIQKREEAIQFESSSIVDIREKPLLPQNQAILCNMVLPLMLSPGRFQLTDQRVYFQHFNHVSAESTTKLEIADIKRIYKRRLLMKDTAMEIFFPVKQASSFGTSYNNISSSSSSSSPLNQTSLYFNFSSTAQRNMIYDLITKQDRFQPLAQQSLTNQTKEWIKGNISNFDYLLFLNQQSGRSWMDLTQYCVMPWVLNDYTSATLDLSNPAIYRDLSKPVGALNEERLKQFQRRMKEMPEEMSHGHPFLYGTHYSSPGYVLYYLVRTCPQYMLRLQNGKFDQPDRLFHAIEASWNSVNHSPTDVKELIPEFYCAPLPNASGSHRGSVTASSFSSSSALGGFLKNSQELDLGTRQNGYAVDDVKLPPWAKGDSAEFVRIMRAALESDYVSKHLHQWIDLIFGFKQNGQEALKANNLFYYLTYENAIDIDSIQDPLQRRSIELQINEFGQTPKQIFYRPHPQRFENNDAAVEQFEREEELQRAQRESQQAGNAQQQSTSNSASPPAASSTSSISANNRESDLPIPINLGIADLNSPGNSSTTLPLNQPLDALTSLSLASTSPSVAALSAEMALLDRGAKALQLAAEVSAIRTKELRVDEGELRKVVAGPATSSSSTASSAPSKHAKPSWNNLSSDGWSKKKSLSLHRDTVTGVQFSSDSNSLVSVSADGHIKIYSLESNKLIRSNKVSDMTLSACCVSPTFPVVWTSCWDNHVYLYNQSYGRIVTSVQAHDDAVSCLQVCGETLVTGSWDTVVKVWGVRESSIDPRPLHELVEHEAAITSVALDASGKIAISGAEDGGIILWDFRTKEALARQVEGFDSAVKCMDFSPCSLDFIVANSDHIRHVDAGGSQGKMLWQVDSIEPLSAVRTDGFSALAVGADSGTLHGWNLRGAEHIMSVDTGGQPQVALAVSSDASMFCVANQKALLFQQTR